MASTLGDLLQYKTNIETMGVKVRATKETDLEFSVYITDVYDDYGNALKVYGSKIHMSESKDFIWVSLPINLYIDSDNIVVRLMENPSIIVADESFDNLCLAVG